MVDGYTLAVTPSAARDLDTIYDYINVTLESHDAAIRLMSKIEKEIRSLTLFPLKYQLSNDPVLKAKGYRKLTIHHYLVLYLVDESNKRVIISRIFYEHQNYCQYV